jgi:hypothetical protein
MRGGVRRIATFEAGTQVGLQNSVTILIVMINIALQYLLRYIQAKDNTKLSIGRSEMLRLCLDLWNRNWYPVQKVVQYCSYYTNGTRTQCPC